MKSLPDTNLSDYFANAKQPLELEVGSHNGEFLCAVATNNPDRHFVGVDQDSRLCDSAKRRALSMELANVEIVHGEGYRFLSGVPDGSLVGLHVYFPQERLSSPKLVDGGFLEHAYRALIPGGYFRLVTDRGRYHAEVCRLIEKSNWWAVEWQDLHTAREETHIVGSYWERRLRAKGTLTFFTLHLIR